MDATAPTLQTAEEFRDAGLIAPAHVGDVRAVLERYVAAVPQSLQAAIAASGAHGPLARQFVPSAAELVSGPDERDDPIGDGAHAPVKGIVHRYPDRVLLMPTYACAVYCRFCFRREQVGPTGSTLSPAELDAALDYIARTPAIWEVILTGGDPLILSPRRLQAIIARINTMEHVQVLRIHTRVPVAAPEQIDDDLIAALRTSPSTAIIPMS
jgi:lysine 2,3-aminomutase